MRPCLLSRRWFLRQGVGLSLLAGGLSHLPLYASEPKWKAAIIGHTGKGNYGHELDVIFNHRDDVQVVAVADPDQTGRTKAAARSKALRQYADYREMLQNEKPQLVSIAPRWTDQHHAMALAALQANAHLYMEKPITQTLAEADELLAFAAEKNLKIAVAHQMPLQPGVQFLLKNLKELIGPLLEIRATGKQDHRAGGEDMVVLGTHLFDLMRLFAGDPLWCSARVLQKGREITKGDARAATESIGPVAGDEILAQFAFANGINGTFTSRAALREVHGPWGLELIGAKNVVRIIPDLVPKMFIRKSEPFEADGQKLGWTQVEGDPGNHLPQNERNAVTANKRVVDDWLDAIENNREPVCSGARATRALEMVMAVFRAGLSKGRVEFPLTDRSHPLL